MSAYEIEYVPMPQKVASSEIYPWNQMVVGNSFLLPCVDGDYDKARHHVRYSARVNGVNIKTRVEPSGGMRVWMTEIKRA